MGYLWLNVRGRYLRQRLLAQALHMAARRPTLLVLAEAQSRAGPEDPPFQDYARHVVLPAHGKTGAGLEVYVRTGTTTRASLLWGAEDANALLMEVLTPWGRHHVLAAHAPQISIGVEPYVRWWAAVWREVTCLVDPTTVLVVTDTNSAARPADRGTPRPEDTGYRTFLRAFNLRDLVDLHPVPQDTYSCFQGAARSRIDTAACHSEAQFTIASYHYWASTLLSDHHVPLLLTIAFPLNRLDKPSPHTVSRTPEYHLGPVALSLADTADFHNSVLRRRAVDPQLAPIRWLKGLQRAIYDWAHATGRVRALRFRQYRLKTRPAERAPPSRAPQQPFPARSMLPTVGRFTVMAQSILGTSVTAGHALKRSLVALGEAQRQQSLRGVKRRALRRKQETLNLKRTPEQWREVQRRSRAPPRDVSEIPLDSKALLNPRETLSALYLSRLRLQGHSYRIRDDPDRWAHFQRYLGLLPQHAPPARGDYVQPRHLWEVQSGKARGPDLRLPEADVCIHISWYRHLTEADQKTLCTVVRSPPVSRTVGRRGRVTLLLKNPDQPPQEANLRGITISSHVSKLEPTAFYAVATAVYERALGGPCLVGGMRGISLQEVVRTVHMKLDLARLQNRIVDVLITDLAKFFDAIAQDIHPIVGARVGLGEADHLATHTEGFSYTLPLGPWQSHTLTQLLGTPQDTVQGVHAGATAALPFLRYMDIAYRSSAVEPFRFLGLMWVDDTIVLLERGDSHPIQGVLLDQRVYYQGILRVDVPDRKIQHGSTSDPRPLRSPTPAAVARHLGRAWVTSTPDQRREALARAPEIQPSRVLRYMGTDIYLQGAPTAPRNLPEVRAELWTQLRPQRLSPDAAMMVLMTKLPSKLLPLASVYRPTAKVHAANDALMVRAYKHVTGISRHAHTDALWGPWEHGC